MNEPLRILIVDCVGKLFKDVSRIVGDSDHYQIKRSGFDVDCREIQPREYDFLLLDEDGGEGIAFLRRCSASGALPIPILYCCEKIDKDVIDAAFAAGATDVARIREMDSAAFGNEICHLMEKFEQRHKMNALLRTIIDTVPGMIYVKDRDANILLANKATADFYGTTVNEIVGSNQVKWHPDVDELKAFQDQDRAVIDQDQRIEGLVDQLTTHDGIHHILETTKIPIDFPERGVRAVLGVSRDVSERIRLQHSRDRLLAALESAGDAMVITGLDGTIEYVNHAFEVLSGYSKKEAIGQTPRLLKSGKQSDEFYEEMWQILLNGETFRAVVTNRRKDGTLFDVEETITPIYDADQNMVAFVAVERDVTEKRLAEQALRSSEERFSLAAEGSNDGLWDWDIVNNRFFASPRMLTMLGADPEMVSISTSEDLLNYVHEEDREDLLKRMTRHLKGLTQYFNHEYRVVMPDGKVRWMQARGVAMRDADGRAYRMAGSQTDITHFKDTEKEMEAQSLRDPLTGLPNRKMFINHITSAINSTEVQENYQAAVLYISIDRYKQVRDSIGVVLADRLISKVSRRLRECMRPSDIIARIHTGDFAVLLPQVLTVNSSEIMARRIEEALIKPFQEESHRIKIAASMGITMIHHKSTRVAEHVLRDAGLAQSAASVARTSYQIYDSAMHEAAIKRIEIENELDHALIDQEFVLFLQPITSLEGEGLTGFEGLIRWFHPDKGMVPPDQFIPVAEETGQIVEIGKWVLREAFNRLSGWHEQGGLREKLYISINLSPLQLKDDPTMELIRQLLSTASFQPSQLRIEITESAILDDAEHTRNQLNKLKSYGTDLYLDDFGTGYSSLSYLHSFPFDVLKIDQSFIREIENDVAKRRITESIIQLAEHLDMRVVAEGVETEAHMNLLKGMGCHKAQGYHFSRPLPPDDVEKYIDQQEKQDAH